MQHAGGFCGRQSQWKLLVFDRRIDTAMASLRGDAPLVRLNLTVLEDAVDQGASTLVERQDSEDIVPPGTSAATAAEALGQKDDEGISTSKALALLSKFGLCRTTCLDLGINGEWYSHAKEEKRLVSINLEVQKLNTNSANTLGSFSDKEKA